MVLNKIAFEKECSPVAGYSGRGNETLDSVEGGELLEELSESKL